MDKKVELLKEQVYIMLNAIYQNGFDAGIHTCLTTVNAGLVSLDIDLLSGKSALGIVKDALERQVGGGRADTEK